MFNMTSIALDNSFKTLFPFVDALVNKMTATVCSTQPPKQVSVCQRSQTGVVSKLCLSITSSYVIINTCIEYLTTQYSTVDS